MGLNVMMFVFWMLNFKPGFSLSCFTFIKRLFSSSLFFAIKVVSSAYLRLLIFLPAILIPACASSSSAFHMMYSAYELNKQGDNIQPGRTPFPIWNQSVVPCLVLHAEYIIWNAGQDKSQTGIKIAGGNISRSFLKFLSIVLVMLSNHLILPPFPFAFNLSQHQCLFQWVSSMQSFGASASTSVLPVNTQGWFPLGLTGLISLPSKGLSRVFSSTTVQKHQFLGFQPYLWSKSHIHTWILEKP